MALTLYDIHLLHQIKREGTTCQALFETHQDKHGGCCIVSVTLLVGRRPETLGTAFKQVSRVHVHSYKHIPSTPHTPRPTSHAQHPHHTQWGSEIIPYKNVGYAVAFKSMAFHRGCLPHPDREKDFYEQHRANDKRYTLRSGQKNPASVDEHKVRGSCFSV